MPIGETVGRGAPSRGLTVPQGIAERVRACRSLAAGKTGGTNQRTECGRREVMTYVFHGWLVPGKGIEPTHLSKLDFEKSAPTFS